MNTLSIQSPVNDAALRRVRGLSRLLDNAIPIPGTSFRVGIDPLIGLIPGIGDVAGLAFSIYIIVEARRLGVDVRTLRRMIFNVAIDGLIGAIPLLGDVFDFGWKSNARNVKLLEQAMR